jgi:hypothetical protein
MKYEKARNLFFSYYTKQKELNKINNDINRYNRNMPYDNGPASEYTMSLIEVEVEKRKELEKEMENIKNEIELILRIFK